MVVVTPHLSADIALVDRLSDARAPTPTPTPACTPVASQGFDDITALPGAGWVQTNHSTTIGTTGWFQGNSAVFPAQGGPTTSYIGANFDNTTGTNTISNWLLTPQLTLQNGAVLTFFTRTVDAPAFPDRLQVRMSTNGASSNVGTTATDVGDFITLLLDINPTYTLTGYPSVWTQFTVTLSGIASPTTGRLALRYFVENGGPTGANSDYIGIDTFVFNGICGPTPTPTPAIPPTPAPDTVYFLYEDFDHTVPPALPSGWSTSFANGAGDCTPTGTCALGTNWKTTKSNPYSGPICVFHDAPGCVTDSYLDARSFGMPNSSNVPNPPIRFMHRFDLESGRDGGVLEISYDGGCFADIVSMGGSANYNGTISTGFQSPIAGRSAWTGNSGGYVSGSATLPSSAKGHNVTLRFRLATDCSGSGSGWRIDVIDVHVHVIGSGPPAPSPTPSPTPIVPPPVCTVNEGFDNVGTLPGSGWVMRNNSGQFRMTDWSNGDTTRFPAQTGAPNSYLAASSSVGCGTISNWLLTPPLTLKNGGVLRFWTRTVDSPTRPDRLQVRMSTNGGSANVGATATSVGDFTALLFDINPTYTTSGYPNVWTQYTAAVSGLGSPVTGRLAFRYFVENGGPNGINSDYIGIDTVSYDCSAMTPTPTPSPTPGEEMFFTPDNHNFGEVMVGSSSDEATFDLYYFGCGCFALPVTLEPAGTSNFSITADNCSDGSILAPGAPCEVRVKFNPQSVGPQTAQLVASGGACQACQGGAHADLSGTGLPSPTPTPCPGCTPTPTPIPAPVRALNLSTRMLVQAGDGVGIGGFIITGTDPKAIVLRGIGPSLGAAGVPNPLADPVLELHGAPGFPTIVNDNANEWCVNPGPTVPPCFPPPIGLPPGNPLESFIGLWLDPGAYTVIMRGNGNPVGVGLVEVYDVSQSVSSKLANLSTRAFVGTGNDILIAGLILGNGSGDDQVVVRGLGPSLGAAGLSSVLANPTLELRNSNGAIVRANDDWQDDPVQAAMLTKLGLAPTNNLESGIVATLQPGAYTALLFGVNSGTGIGLVEVYDNLASGPTPSPTPGGSATPSPTPGGG